MDQMEVQAEWGRRIRRIRRESELTAVSVAKDAGITPRYLHALERGTYAPSIGVQQRIAKALSVEAGEIFSHDLADAS
jgi:transcriptional regulator with XRE-family HTH domain